MPAADDADEVTLTDLAVIQQFSLAVRGRTASRADVVAALEADLAWLGAAPAPRPARRPAARPAATPTPRPARATRAPADEGDAAPPARRPARRTRRTAADAGTADAAAAPHGDEA